MRYHKYEKCGITVFVFDGTKDFEIMSRNIYARWQINKVYEALKTRRVVLLEGARQCGKTTLAKKLNFDNAIYRTLDDLMFLQNAIDDPTGFISHGDELMIIDEIQRAPDLLLSIKMDVDENTSYGRYLLTGSANIYSLPSVRESLAGRISKIRLRPLAMGEIFGKTPDFIENAFKEEFKVSKKDEKKSNHSFYFRSDYISLAMRGGYPEAVELSDLDFIGKWHKDYLAVLIDRDLKDVTEIKRKDSLKKLVEVLAAWSSKEINISKIGSYLSLSRSAMESYINALETMYLVERVRPWHSTDYDRVKKQDKIFMTDTGFMCSVLKWKFEQVQFDTNLNGKLIETFVFNQLSAILESQKDSYDLFHYRDREKREVDFLIENPSGDILGIEVTGASAIGKDKFKHLKWFNENMVSDKRFIGIVLYSGEHVLSFGENMWAVPISALWA